MRFLLKDLGLVEEIDEVDWDFSIAFQDVVFSVAPCAIALAIVPFRLKSLWRREPVVKWPVVERAKMALYCFVGVAQLSTLGLLAGGSSSSSPETRTNLTVPADVLSLVATMALASMSALDGPRTLAPSATLQVFFLLTTFFGATRARTLWLADARPSRLTTTTTRAAAASAVSVETVLRAILLALESLHKVGHAKGKTDGVSREKASGIFSRSFLWWLNPLILLGNRKGLTVEDMYEVDLSLTGLATEEKLSEAWGEADQDKKNALFWATYRAFMGPYFLVMIPNLSLAFFTILQPLLIERVIKFVQDPDMPVSHGYGLIGGYVVVYLGVVVSTAWSGNISARFVVRLRAALVAIVYRGMLLVRAESKSSSDAMSIMGAEVERILQMQPFITSLFPSIVQIIVAAVVLGTKLGFLAIVPIAIAAIIGLVSLPFAKMVAPRQRQWMMAIQKRVATTSDIFSAIKGVKMTGLSGNVQTQLQGLRDFELEESKRFRRVQIAHVLLGQFASILTPALTFAAFAAIQSVRGGAPLDVSTAFTALGLLNILINPVATLMMITPTLTSALQCFTRIQEFLKQEKRDDFRIFKLPPPETSAAPGLGPPAIQISNASFGWTRESDGGGGAAAAATTTTTTTKPPVLQDVTLDIPRGGLVVVVGPVASGKSTLLKSLVGETYRLKGTVVCSSARMAYCDQEPWILNQTIRDNILGGDEFDQEFYRKVIVACQLRDDLDAMPEEDHTVVGSQGASLSGGQKHRVALARAAYSRKDIIIVDDSLKGLDADTAKACFEALLAQGGLMRSDRQTVVLATHNAQWLPYADKIVALTESGSIAETGTYEELSSNGGYISTLKKQGAISSSTPQPNDHGSDKKQNRQAKKPGPVGAAATETKKIDRGGRGAFSYYLKSMGRVSLPVFVLFCALQVGFRTFGKVWLKLWVSANEEHPNADTAWWVGLYILWGLLTEVMLLFEAWFLLVIVIPHSAKVLHLGVLKAALAAPLSFFVGTDLGEIVNRFSQDMRLIDLPLPISFMLFVENLLGCLSELALTCVSSGGRLVVALPPLFAVLYLVQTRYLASSRQVRVLETEVKAPLFGHFISTATGIVTVRAYGLQGKVRAQNLALIDTAQRPFYALSCMQAWLSVVISGILATVAVLLVGLAVSMRRTTDPGYLGVALVSVTAFGQVLGYWLKHWANLEESLGAVDRVRRFETETPREKDGGEDPGATWPHMGAVALRGVCAAYGDHEVLKDINVAIEPGQKVAVCGRTGSGKSTLLALLLRLHDPSEGTIFMDGVDISTVRLETLRTSVAAMPQDPLFLPGTIRANLDPFGTASRNGDGSIWDALERTKLDELVRDKGGLDVRLDTDWLSAGQKQLFCMARAILRRGRILLLDEATSSLDDRTEEIVQAVIEKDFNEWTVIMIAHRLKTVRNFDKVIALQDGRVVEFDSPDKLLERHGLFSTLWKLQED